jgi:hypothetical protein
MDMTHHAGPNIDTRVNEYFLLSFQDLEICGTFHAKDLVE